MNREYLAQRGVHRDHTPLWLHVASPLSHWEVDPRSRLRPVSCATCPSDVCSLLSTSVTIRAAVPIRIPQGHSRMPHTGCRLLRERCPGLSSGSLPTTAFAFAFPLLFLLLLCPASLMFYLPLLFLSGIWSFKSPVRRLHRCMIWMIVALTPVLPRVDCGVQRSLG